MNHTLVTAVLVALLQTGSPSSSSVAHDPSDAALLELRQLQAVGMVRVVAEKGPRLSVSIESEGRTREQHFDFAFLPPEARVIDAEVGTFLRTGIVIALAIQVGNETLYHYLIEREFPEQEQTWRIDKSIANGTVCFSNELFRSTGEPYRIVEAHGPGDGVEITFRRGWPKIYSPSVTIDEKVVFDPCAGGVAPSNAGQARIFAVDVAR